VRRPHGSAADFPGTDVPRGFDRGHPHDPVAGLTGMRDVGEDVHDSFHLVVVGHDLDTYLVRKIREFFLDRFRVAAVRPAAAAVHARNAHAGETLDLVESAAYARQLERLNDGLDFLQVLSLSFDAFVFEPAI